jgi:hypothetical protein
MKMKNYVGVVAMLLLCCISSTVEASVYGSALLSTSNMRVERSGAVAGPYSAITPADLSVISSTLTVVNTANLNAAMDQEIGFFPIPVPVADTLQAYLTSGADPAPPENTFAHTTPLPATSAFSRADAITTGSLLAPPGLSTSTIAEIEATDLSLGDSASSTSGSSTFLLTVAQSGFYRLSFDSLLHVAVSSIGPPADRIAFATTSLTIQLNTTFISLNAPIAALTTNLSGTASTGPTATLGITTDGIFLAANTVHTLTIGQTVTAGLKAVPEPGSLLAFAGLFVVGGFNSLRRVRRS